MRNFSPVLVALVTLVAVGLPGEETTHAIGLSSSLSEHAQTTLGYDTGALLEHITTDTDQTPKNEK